jgi:hypothetical protein
MQTSFSLSSAMVNDNLHSLLGAARRNTQTSAALVNDNMLNFGSEIIDYVVIQQPSISISTGAATVYSLIGEVKNNFAIYPSPNNLLIYKTFNPIWMGKQYPKLEGLGYHGSIGGAIAPPTKDADMVKFTKKLPDVVDQGGMGDSNQASALPHSDLYSYLNHKYDTIQFLRRKSASELTAMHDDIEDIAEYNASRLQYPTAPVAVSVIMGGLKLLSNAVSPDLIPKGVKKKLRRQLNGTLGSSGKMPNNKRFSQEEHKQGGSQQQLRNKNPGPTEESKTGAKPTTVSSNAQSKQYQRKTKNINDSKKV